MPLVEDLGLIGNGQFAAHVSSEGEVVWCCLPRLDADPVFARLLDAERGGGFEIGPPGGGLGRQRYLPNTNALTTEFEDDQGAFRVVDFAPRFEQHQRAFHPTQLFRIIEPLRDAPGPGALRPSAGVVRSSRREESTGRTTSASRATPPSSGSPRTSRSRTSPASRSP